MARPDFTDRELAGRAFTRQGLASACFIRADLTSARFTNCDLRGADFEDAVLLGARFTDCNLEGARFAHATVGLAPRWGRASRWGGIAAGVMAALVGSLLIGVNVGVGFYEGPGPELAVYRIALAWQLLVAAIWVVVGARARALLLVSPLLIGLGGMPSTPRDFLFMTALGALWLAFLALSSICTALLGRRFTVSAAAIGALTLLTGTWALVRERGWELGPAMVAFAVPTGTITAVLWALQRRIEAGANGHSWSTRCAEYVRRYGVTRWRGCSLAAADFTGVDPAVWKMIVTDPSAPRANLPT